MTTVFYSLALLSLLNSIKICVVAAVATFFWKIFNFLLQISVTLYPY